MCALFDLCRALPPASEPKLILGLMSGTSLDGLDIALIRLSGCGKSTDWQLDLFTTEPYTPEEKEVLSQVAFKSSSHLHKISLLNRQVAEWHLKKIKKTFKKKNISLTDVAFAGSHGQTIFHENNIHTLQIGDGEFLAKGLGIPVVSDFRQSHLAAGGKGAPLASYGDYLLFYEPDQERVLLNIGGISNITVLGKGKMIAYDTGPGNTLIDHYSRTLYGKPFDDGGKVASAGNVNEDVLHAMMEDEYFTMIPPKSTGPEYFNKDWAENYFKISAEKPEDILATLSALTAHSIAHALRDTEGEIFYSGGGGYNRFIIHLLTDLLPNRDINPVNQLNMPGDAKEAVIFGILANERIYNSSPAYPINPNITIGKISLPH